MSVTAFWRPGATIVCVAKLANACGCAIAGIQWVTMPAETAQNLELTSASRKIVGVQVQVLSQMMLHFIAL